MDTLIEFVGGFVGSPEFTAWLLTAFAGVVTAVVGWVGVQIRQRILRQLSAAELALLREIAAVTVRYVEQKYRELESSAKLAEALRVADAYLVAYGLQVSSEQLLAIIEAAVYDEFNRTFGVIESQPVPDPGPALPAVEPISP